MLSRPVEALQNTKSNRGKCIQLSARLSVIVPALERCSRDADIQPLDNLLSEVHLARRALTKAFANNVTDPCKHPPQIQTCFDEFNHMDAVHALSCLARGLQELSCLVLASEFKARVQVWWFVLR